MATCMYVKLWMLCSLQHFYFIHWIVFKVQSKSKCNPSEFCKQKLAFKVCLQQHTVTFCMLALVFCSACDVYLKNGLWYSFICEVLCTLILCLSRWCHISRWQDRSNDCILRLKFRPLFLLLYLQVEGLGLFSSYCILMLKVWVPLPPFKTMTVCSASGSAAAPMSDCQNLGVTVTLDVTSPWKHTHPTRDAQLI